MAGRRQDMVGQSLEHVADIDRQSARGRHDRQPVPIAVLEFQPAFLGAQQQRDEIDVLMRTRANAGRLRLLLKSIRRHQDRSIVQPKGFLPPFTFISRSGFDTQTLA